MKKYTFLLGLLLFSVTSFSQKVTYSISGVTNKKITTQGDAISAIPVDKKVIIQGIINDPVYKNCYWVKVDDYTLKVSFSDFNKITLDKPTTKNELWQFIRINSDFDKSYLSRGYQYDLRKDLEDESIEALQNLEKYYGFFNDAFLEDYISGLLFKIHSFTLDDGRPGNLAVRILKSSQPNAFSTPEGTIILTTGLLSTIRSEDELIAILTHEVAHFVLDHQVININKETERQKRAEFWAGFSTVAAAASEVYFASKYDYYPTGEFTRGTAILSTAVASSIIERLGTNYDRAQELEADNTTTKVLIFLNRDPKALSAALSRIRNYFTLNGDYFALSGSGTYPALSERIATIGDVDPARFISSQYDKTFSLINTYNSFNEYELNHFETALDLTTRNIESGVATEDDYIVKAMSVRLLSDTFEKYQEALDLLSKAKTLNILPRNYVYKQEGITLLRLGKQKEAGDAFMNYLKNLEIENDNSAFYSDEIEWTKKMILKVSVL
jgi:beta-barrel assembly-enhancing protease